MNTKDKIPQSVTSVLWSYDLNKIDLEEHKKIRINAITKKSSYNKGFNEAVDLFTKEILARSKMERIIICLHQIMTNKGLGQTLNTNLKELAQAIQTLIREGR